MALVFLACGDPSGPNPEPGPTPSVLTAEFRGWVPPNRTPNGVSWVVDISWTACPDSDFVSYDLYRSLTPDVASSPTAMLLTTATEVYDTTFTDGSGNWETTCYYAVMTSNAGAEYSWSNEDTVSVGSETFYGGPDTFSREIAIGAGPVGICTSGLTDETFVAFTSTTKCMCLEHHLSSSQSRPLSQSVPGQWMFAQTDRLFSLRAQRITPSQ